MKQRDKKTLIWAVGSILFITVLGWLFHVLPPLPLKIVAGILTTAVIFGILLFAGAWGSIKKLWKRLWG